MLAFGMPGGTEWLVILIVALLIFGSRLPKVMRSLGQSVSEFKRGVNESFDEKEDEPRGRDEKRGDGHEEKEKVAKDEGKKTIA